MLDEVFNGFVEASPASVMARGLTERLLNPEQLDAWFDEQDHSQYTRELMFSSVFSLMSQVVCGSQKSINAAYQSAKKEVPTSVVSVYAKLKSIEPNTSAQLVRYAADEARALIEDLGGELAPPLSGYRTKLLDGNCLAVTEHRLRELRSDSAGPLLGKSLVVFDPALGLPIDVFPCEDGHAQERILLGPVLETVVPGDLWIGDRNFCTKGFLTSIANSGAHFILREHKKLAWKPTKKGSLARSAGKTETGSVREQKVEVIDAAGQTHVLRRIELTLKSSTRDGDKRIVLLSNLPKSGASARKIADLYRGRWTIETAFQELAAHLNSEIKTLGYPRAALFGFCVALVAYIVMAALKAAMRSVHGAETINENLSGYYLADELSNVYRGMMIAIPQQHWQTFRELEKRELVNLLQHLAGKINLDRFQKSRRGPKNPSQKRSHDKGKPHVSTARVLATRKPK